MADITAAAASGMPLSKVLPPYMPVFYVSFLVTLLLTPMMRMLAHRHGITDDPDGKRKVHTQPIAYLGGVSIFLGWVAGITVSVFLRPHNAEITQLSSIQMPPGVLVGAAMVVLFGLLDDVYSLSPKIKLLGQMLAALFLVVPGAIGFGQDYFLGVSREASGSVHTNGIAWMVLLPLGRYGLIPPLDPATMQTVVLAAAVCSALAAIFIIISTCNACNLLDGLDGLCSGVTGVMSVGYLILATYLASQGIAGEGGAAVDPVRLTLSMALLGAVLGFLPFNFNPASIFMGDTGSMFLGYMCGTMMLLFAHDGTLPWFLSAVVIFGLPLMDTLLAIVRRKLNGKPVFSPDSNHFHHFLIKRGLTVKKAVLLSYTIAALFVSFALMIVIVPTRVAMGLYLVIFGWLVVGAFKMGMIFQQKAPVIANNTINMTVLNGAPGTVSTAAMGATGAVEAKAASAAGTPVPALVGVDGGK